MQLAGQIMMGAQGRLLPPSISYRFFVASGVYHVLGWVLMYAGADQVPGYQGGPGLVLATLHAITLGVFVMTAIGASFQILPVVTNQSMSSLWPLRLVSWLFIPGVGVLIAGFAVADQMVISVGGILATSGLSIYALIILKLLGKARGFKVMSIHIRLGFVALAAFIILGLGMIFNILPTDQSATAAAHGTLAAFGFMGLFAMGFGSILVPIFVLGNPASEGRSIFVMTVYVTGLVLAAGGTLAEFYELALIGAGLLLIGAVNHAQMMIGVMKKGMKKKLGLSFVLIRTSWVFFPIGIALGVAAVSGVPIDQAMLIAGYVVIFCWLLTFVLGVQQQIMPFLAAMNVSKSGGKSPRLSELAKGRPLKIHAVCHFAALGLVSIGIVANMEAPVQGGAVIGIVGAISFLWFTLDVFRRMKASGRKESTQMPPTQNKER